MPTPTGGETKAEIDPSWYLAEMLPNARYVPENCQRSEF